MHPVWSWLVIPQGMINALRKWRIASRCVTIVDDASSALYINDPKRKVGDYKTLLHPTHPSQNGSNAWNTCKKSREVSLDFCYGSTFINLVNQQLPNLPLSNDRYSYRPLLRSVCHAKQWLDRLDRRQRVFWFLGWEVGEKLRVGSSRREKVWFAQH